MDNKQEPKYIARTAAGETARLFNRSTAQPIPDDEPVFVFRGQDRKALLALEAYYQGCQHPDHRAVIRSRIRDFEHFAAQHPERMKEPDSTMRDLARANVAPRT